MLEVEIVPYFVTNIYKGLSHKDCLALDNVKFRNMDPQESGSDDGRMRPDTGTSLLKIGRKQDISGNRGKDNGKDQGDDSKTPLQGRQDSGQAGKTAKRH